jgi:hypothetical protein
MLWLSTDSQRTGIDAESGGRRPVDEPLDLISMPGVFDPEGEPEIRVMADGSLYVVFNFMPPS